MSVGEIVLLFLRLGAVSFGGGLSVLAEVQREVVEERGALTEEEFATAFALGQATPGPGILYLVPLGYRLAGVPGAIAALASFLVPPLFFQLVVARQWDRLHRSGWVRATNRALVPISIGLVGASLHTLGSPLLGDPLDAAWLVVATAAALASRVTPTLVVLGAGAIGLAAALGR